MSIETARPAGDLRHPRRTGSPLPHPIVSLGAAVGAVIGLWPSGLPRDAMISAAVTAVCTAIATVLGLVVARRRSARPPTRVASAAVAAGIVVCAGVLSLAWQNALRGDLGAPAVGAEWFAVSVVPASILFAAVVYLPRVTALITATVTATLAGYLPAAQADGAQPAPRAPATVIYSGVEDAPLAQRSHALASRWVSAGGLDRRAVVIAVPTGSGWVDAGAVSGFVDRFDGDVAVLALQYGDQPSWRAFVGDRSAAGRSATAVLREVIDRTRARPTGARPEIIVYGQSLGAIGAEDARVWAAIHRPGAVTETLLTGVPGGSVDAGPGPGSVRVIRANASDPVPRWSISVLWRPVQQPAGTLITGRPVRRPPWLPVAGFVQTSADLLVSLDGPAGVGHRYGPEQSSPPARS
ncbi:alpha/beta-hydrolase family protein [Gordonia insulae]|uniref:Alpha/beta-hydrolase catalytic domain-containing protein n=1 Tax=Gordonia insulae TaxID=2420509 RepID=A0A3G8JUJ0_9ACTN|nr:alpha/beta-hydrolase family protein [Gordonia insulae]AZG48824.1 hypothetical protein D7316_05445 [Gordonia insulae]